MNDQPWWALPRAKIMLMLVVWGWTFTLSVAGALTGAGWAIGRRNRPT